MKFLHELFEKQKPLFEKGGKFEKYFYVFEAAETFNFTPGTTAGVRGAHVRDAVDLKRTMMTVVIAMLPCFLFGVWNVGAQHFASTGNTSASLVEQILIGLQVVLPLVIVSYTTGGLAEVVFGIIRRHPINEGFLVSGLLIPLVIAPNTPWWQVMLATLFAVVLGKEAFGGTGMNVLNVALTARAFLYFAYPTEISGDVWTYFGDAKAIEGFSGATALAIAAETKTGSVVEALNAAGLTFESLFMGTVAGSIGETSTLMCILGALILIATGVGSWKVMVSSVLGALTLGYICNAFAVNPYMELPAYYHLVVGGFAFGTVFMATDPVTAAHTETGKWFYGFFIGALTVIIRVFNPAYPEGIMLAILLMNVFSPLIDYFVIEANKKRRLNRATL